MTATRQPVTGFPVNLYKHLASDCSAGGTSARTDRVLVVDVVNRTRGGGYVRHSLPRSMRLTQPRPGDALMVLVHRPGQQWPVLYDAQIGPDGELQVASWGMFSGVFAHTSDSRWNELVGGHPVPMHDRHEHTPSWVPVTDR